MILLSVLLYEINGKERIRVTNQITDAHVSCQPKIDGNRSSRSTGAYGLAYHRPDQARLFS